VIYEKVWEKGGQSRDIGSLIRSRVGLMTLAEEVENLESKTHHHTVRIEMPDRENQDSR